MKKTTLGGTEVGVNVDMTSKICFALQPLRNIAFSNSYDFVPIETE
jgi:hypothetical protein